MPFSGCVSGQSRLVGPQIAAGRLRPGVAGGVGPDTVGESGVATLGRHARVIGRRHRRRVERIEVKTVLGGNLREARRPRKKDRLAALHRLEHRESKALSERWKQERLAVFVEPLAIGVGDFTRQNRPALESPANDLASEKVSVGGRLLAGDDQPRPVRTEAGQRFEVLARRIAHVR